MNDDTAKANSRAARRGTVYALTSLPHRGEEQSKRAAMHRRVWLGAVVAAFCVFCVVGLILTNRIRLIQRPAPQQERFNALVRQLSSLTQSDLIVFADGRVWYVRAVRGKDMEVVGWIGDNARSENIDSFVLRNEQFTIVRHQDPAWPLQRDKYLNQ
jgi:hypothetical protein